jgi:hypothetical protein
MIISSFLTFVIQWHSSFLSSLKPLGQFKPNLAWMVLGRRSEGRVEGFQKTSNSSILHPRWPPSPVRDISKNS